MSELQSDIDPINSVTFLWIKRGLCVLSMDQKQEGRKSNERA